MAEVLWSGRKRNWFGLPWTFTKYTVQSDKMLIETGILSKNEDQVRLYRITDIKLTRSLRQRLFNLGTIYCYSSDRSMGDFELKNIRPCREVMEMLSEAIEKARKENRVFSRESIDDYEEPDGFQE